MSVADFNDSVTRLLQAREWGLYKVSISSRSTPVSPPVHTLPYLSMAVKHEVTLYDVRSTLDPPAWSPNVWRVRYGVRHLHLRGMLKYYSTASF